MDRIFEALASGVRRKILVYLSESSLTAGEIAERFEISKPSLSKHLSTLEAAGLVWREKRGQYVHYGLEQDKLANSLTLFMAQACPESRVLRKEAVQRASEKGGAA